MSLNKINTAPDAHPMLLKVLLHNRLLNKDRLTRVVSFLGVIKTSPCCLDKQNIKYQHIWNSAVCIRDEFLVSWTFNLCYESIPLRFFLFYFRYILKTIKCYLCITITFVYVIITAMVLKKNKQSRGRQTQSEGTIWSRSEKDFRQTAL